MNDTRRGVGMRSAGCCLVTAFTGNVKESADKTVVMGTIIVNRHVLRVA